MNINDSVLRPGEKLIFALRELYLSYGYTPYKMSKFEEYDLYAKNKDFLVSDNVITFTDIGGKLMALKPDVTLSIIKSSTDQPYQTQKVFYNENVYRVSKSTDSFKEIMQSGVECFGNVGKNEIAEMLSLACDSLAFLSDDMRIAVSNLDVLSEVIDRITDSAEAKKRFYAAIGEKNGNEIENLCRSSADPQAASLLQQLLLIHGSAAETLPTLQKLGRTYAVRALESFADILECCTAKCEKIIIDFSVIGDINYYNGVIFNGFVKNIPSAVLSGGQYDRLMRKLGRKSSAVGFAVYNDLLERVDLSEDAAAKPDDGYINIALPKGRLGEKIYDMFARAGFECPSILEENRKLIFENEEKKVRYFWVKPSDVAIYVERGAADIGVAGKDILLEYEPDVYELLDLKKGVCRMAVAAPNGYQDDQEQTLRVATKFSNVAKRFYRQKGRDIDIIHLNGSIEIAPILKLSDVIVDIVETGTTLKENDLSVIEEVFPISARLVANKSAFKFKFSQIEQIAQGLRKITEESK